MTQQYVLVERSQHDSRLTPGARMSRFTWYGLEDGQLWEMTTDSGFRNWRRNGWNLLVEDPEPWGVYQGLRRTQRRTREGMPIITADSRPGLVYRCRDRAEALELVRWDQAQRHGETQEQDHAHFEFS